MIKLPSLTVDGITYPEAHQAVLLIADGEQSEFGALEDAQRHLRCLQLNGRYPETVRLFSCLSGGWLEVPL